MEIPYKNLLKLFFRGPKSFEKGRDFHYMPDEEAKIKAVSKYLNTEYLREEEEIKEENSRLMNPSMSQHFFNNANIIDELSLLFFLRDIYFDRISENFQFFDDGEQIEFDLVAYAEDGLLFMNIYSYVDRDEINLFIKDLKTVREKFSEYSNSKIIGAIGVLDIEPETIKYAYAKGLFVLQKTENEINILNRKTFKPKNY